MSNLIKDDEKKYSDNNESISENNLNVNDNDLNEDAKNNNRNDNISEPQDEEQGDTPLPEKYNIKFFYLCKLFAKLGTLKPKDKVKCVKKFIEYFFKDALTEKVTLFQFYRLLFPKLDRLRSTYGIAEVFISKLYVDILQLPQKEKLMLKHWKNPNFIPSPAPVGDYVGLLKFVINNRVTNNSTITINTVNEYLTSLCRTRDKEVRTKIMSNIIKECTSEEQRWIISIILKDLKIGLSYESFFKNFDIRAVDIYNSTSSLISVCEYLSDPKNDKYSQTFYQVFSPIKPMLVARMTLDNIMKTFQGVNAIVETKYDGERIQCHLHENEVQFFTRKGVDYTAIYGPKFSHLIKTSINAKSAILDGEIVVYDKVNQKFAPFGDNKTIAKEIIETDKCLVYEIFDIIYLTSPNGQIYSLNNVILSDRKKILSKIVTPVPNKIEIVLGIEVNSIDEIMAQFNLALQRAEEGIVIKRSDSIYKPDKRCPDWVKMKCDYIDTIVDTLDLIIIGGYYGEGKRTVNNTFSQSIPNSINNMSNILNNSNNDFYSDSVTTFLMGIVKELDEKNPSKSVILPIVKVGSGYNMTTLNIIRNKLRAYWKKYDSKNPPTLFGNWKPAQSEKPDVYLDDPSTSIILEVKAAEIVPSETFPAKVTLRFPRVVKTRFDKSWNDALQYDELIKLYDISLNNVKKNNELYKSDSNNDGNVLQHKHIIKRGKRKNIMNSLESEADSDISSEEFRGKKNKKDEIYSRILPSFRDTDTTYVNKISNLFQGFQFLILLLDDSVTLNSTMKQNLEYLIVEHGGEKVQNYLSSVTHIIGNKFDLRAQNILKLHDVNIIKSKWVEDCVKNKKIMKISPKYLTYANKETKEIFSSTIDKYGDSFYEEIDIQTLEGIFENIKIKDIDKEYEIALEELLKEYKDNGLFNQLIIKDIK
jgi:DNA ligase-4